ncbi:VWA domain-containing protein [Photobacterium sp. DNB23_23_1]
MVSFFSPVWLLGLLVAPAIYWVDYRRQQQGLIAPHLQKKTISRNQIRLWLILAWLLAMVALAGPHWREQDRPHSELERARIVVMDMSKAMSATDISPNRFQQAFYKTTDLIKLLDEGYTGLVAYSNEGYTISPLTHDNHTVLAHIEHLSPEVMPTEGKNAAAGVKEAIRLLGQTQFAYGDILLVTSGISEAESLAIEDLLVDTHYSLSTYAISTPQGATIYREDGKPYLGVDGQPVVSRLVPERLSVLANKTGGIAVTYQHSQDDIEQLQSFLQKLRSIGELREQSDSLSAQFINDGYWLLWPLMGMLLFAFRRGVVYSLGLVLLLPVSQTEAAEPSQLWKNADRQGYSYYQQQRYIDAAYAFRDPAWQGVALYEAGDYQGAVEAFSQVTDGSSDYNHGNALAKLGQLEDAGQKYREVIERNPTHKGARLNLNLVEEALLAQELQALENQEQQGEAGDDGNADEQENGEGDGDKDREDNGYDEQDGGQDNLESDPDTENDPEQKGVSEQTGSSHSDDGNSDQPQFSDEGGGEPQPPQQQFGESGEYDADKFTAGDIDIDFGTPTEDDMEAIRHQLSELGDMNPVLNRLTQIQDDRTLLLRNLLLLQAEQKQPLEQTEIEW